MRKLGVEEWTVRVVPSMYVREKSRERIKNQHSNEFGVNVGGHQKFLLSLPLFIFVLKALFRKFSTGAL